MCAELERHKLVSAELASHRQQYEAVRAELDMRIATEARHVSSSEAKIAALRADCERLHQQLEHERAACVPSICTRLSRLKVCCLIRFSSGLVLSISYLPDLKSTAAPRLARVYPACELMVGYAV